MLRLGSPNEPARVAAQRHLVQSNPSAGITRHAGRRRPETAISMLIHCGALGLWTDHVGEIPDSKPDSCHLSIGTIVRRLVEALGLPAVAQPHISTLWGSRRPFRPVAQSPGANRLSLK